MLQHPPYYNLDDRIDRIADAALGDVALSDAVAQVTAANPEWAYDSAHPTGFAYIPNAVAPDAANPTALGSARARATNETQRPDMAALKARMDGPSAAAGDQGDPEAYLQSVVYGYSPDKQIKPDLSGFETDLREAAFWDAQVRAITPLGSMWGAPALGSDLLDYALFQGRTISPAALAAAAAIAEAAMRQNPGWYSQAFGRYDAEDPTTLRLLAALGVAAAAPAQPA